MGWVGRGLGFLLGCLSLAGNGWGFLDGRLRKTLEIESEVVGGVLRAGERCACWVEGFEVVEGDFVERML